MKLRGVRQRDSADCGAACIAFIAQYYGRFESVLQIREWAGTDIHGTTVYGILKAAERMGMETRALRCRSDALDGLAFPLIAHVQLQNGAGHFIVIVNISKGQFTIMDPADGQIRRATELWLKGCWTGVVVTMAPGDQFETNKRITTRSHVAGIAKAHWIGLIAALACAITYAFTGLGMSVYIQMVVDDVLSAHNASMLPGLSITMLLLLMITGLAGYMKSRLVLRISQGIDRTLILGYIHHVLHLPRSFHDRMKSGEIISRINDAGRVNMFINDVLLHLVIDSLTMILSLMLMFVYSWKLALLTALLLPFYVLLFWWNDVVNRRWQRKYLQAGADFDSMVVQLLHNVSTVKQLALERFAGKKLETVFNDVLRIARLIAGRQILIQSLMDFGTKAATVAIVCTGCLMIFDNKMSTGELIAYISMLAYFSVPAMSMMGAGKQVRDTVISCDRLFEVNDLPAESSSTGTFSEVKGNIEFREVSFGYSSGQLVLEKLSFTALEGAITGITGESGSGKTTLLSLLLNLYTATGGEITVGGVDIRNMPLAQLRKAISVVPQNIELFNSSIRENICLDEITHYDSGRLREAIERSGVAAFCSRLSHGLDTCVVEHGTNFSGGQRQMIGIARAIYRNTPYLVLDEPTASMDRISETIIMQTIEWYKNNGNTVIIISHSDTALKICDNIVILKKQPSVSL